MRSRRWIVLLAATALSACSGRPATTAHVRAADETDSGSSVTTIVIGATVPTATIPNTTVPRPTVPRATGSTLSAPVATVTVNQDDNGKTFTLRTGQHMVVSLSDASWQWSEPDTDNGSVLARTAVSANPSSDHVTAAFEAKKGGQAHVSASKDAPCRTSSPPCMVPTYLWQITVNVI